MTPENRNWILPIVFFVGIVPGWVLSRGVAPPPPAPTPAPPHPAAKHWTLTVGPDPCNVSEEGKLVPVAVISKAGKHSIRYTPAAGEKLVSIVFHGPAGKRPPFAKVKAAGTDADGLTLWKLACDTAPTNVCITGPAQPDAEAKAGGTYYKTDQVLEGKKACDAGIIIQP